MSSEVISGNNILKSTESGNTNGPNSSNINVSTKSSIKVNENKTNPFLLKERTPASTNATTKVTSPVDMHKRNELLSDMSKIIFKSIPFIPRIEKIVQTIKKEKKEIDEIDKKIGELNKKLTTLKQQNEKDAVNNQIGKLKSDAQAISSTIDKLWEEYDDLSEKAGCPKGDLSIAKSLASKIFLAVKHNLFTYDFVKDLCDQFSKFEPLPSFLINIRESLRAIALSSNPFTLIGFEKNVKDYIKQVNDSQDMSLKKELLGKALDFIYNTIAFPHQRSGEGSCYATATAMAIYHNQKIDYMKILRGIIDKNIADFSCLGSKVAPIKVDNFGLDCDFFDETYQKLMSAIAELCPSIIERKKGRFGLKIKEICKNLEAEVAEIINNTVMSKGVVWNHTRMPAICAITTVLNNETEVIKNMVNIIKNAIATEHKSVSEEIIQEIAEKIFANVKESGGNPGEVAQNLSGATNIQKMEKMYEATSTQNSIFESSEIRQILNILEYGDPYEVRPDKLREKQAILGSYLGGDGGHAFIFFSGHYDIGTMKAGDKIAIGHSNYADDMCDDSYIYLLKLDDDHYQLILGDEPLEKWIDDIQIFPGFATKYEPAPISPLPLQSFLRANPFKTPSQNPNPPKTLTPSKDPFAVPTPKTNPFTKK